MPHLHLPAQSGSDAVLRRMARRNRVADFEALVAAARDRIPGLTVTTDLIVGFPGETEERFRADGGVRAPAGLCPHAHLPLLGAPGHGGGALRRAGARARAQAPGAGGWPSWTPRSAAACATPFVGQVRPVLWESAELKTDARWRRCGRG